MTRPDTPVAQRWKVGDLSQRGWHWGVKSNSEVPVVGYYSVPGKATSEPLYSASALLAAEARGREEAEIALASIRHHAQIINPHNYADQRLYLLRDIDRLIAARGTP